MPRYNAYERTRRLGALQKPRALDELPQDDR
jgi:hypothetical protein